MKQPTLYTCILKIVNGKTIDYFFISFLLPGLLVENPDNGWYGYYIGLKDEGQNATFIWNDGTQVHHSPPLQLHLHTHTPNTPTHPTPQYTTTYTPHTPTPHPDTSRLKYIVVHTTYPFLLHSYPHTPTHL